MGKGNGNGKDIRGSRNQCASRITWDAPVFTERKGKGKKIRGSRNQCALRITWDAPVLLTINFILIILVIKNGKNNYNKIL